MKIILGGEAHLVLNNNYSFTCNMVQNSITYMHPTRHVDIVSHPILVVYFFYLDIWKFWL